MTKTISKIIIALAAFVFSATSLHAGSVSAYYSAPYKDAGAVKSALTKEGFTVLNTYTPAGKSKLKVITYTSAKLKNMASKPKRGFAAVQKILVNTKAKTVLASNPTYWLKAFLQKDFKGGDAAITASLTKALGKLKPTADTLSSGKLSGYHFMMAMPYYEDMIELKKGAKGVKNALYSLKLGSGATLYGVKMSKGTEKFISKIGEDKALVLPYTILIEDGKAYALHAKYYLAISYPKLTMGQFMKISDVPGTIEIQLKKAVK